VFYSDLSSSFLSASHFIDTDENCSNINGLIDTIPLINGFVTNYGAVPLKAEQNYALNYFTDCSFLYNQVSHQFSYYASGKPLTYRFSFLEGISGHTSGSVSANITPLTHTNKQRYIFEIGTGFALLINSYGYLAYVIDDNDPIATSISIPTNSLHRITVSWMYGIVVDSVPTTNTRFTIRVNNQVTSFIYRSSIFWLDNPLINFGNKQNQMLYPLYGFIDSVVITKAELNTVQINTINNNFKSVNILNKYSSNQFLNGRQFYNEDNKIIEQNFCYSINPNQGNSPINQDVHRETFVYQIEDSRNSIVTDYTYDILHRLTTITPFDGGTSNNIQYTYDSLNRLTRSHQSNGDDFSYAYDSTHNILNVINNHSSTTVHSMTYSMNRMMSFDNYVLTYDPNYIFNPYQYGVFDSNNVLTNGLTFAFMGKRLINVTKTGTFDIPSMSFAYDFSGKRLSKTINGVIHQYYYDGDKLVYETETNVASSILLHEKKFFYDENGILTFMELDGVRYFYYLDATHTVRGLFNSDGEFIVRYSYDAWGNVTNIIDYSSISLSTLNPFLFKCYYYDHESKWYYCLSRYYVPLWMRWLSIDDSSYLTSESPAGYNLYVYCNNNPIMYEDPSGLEAIALIGFSLALIVLIVSLITLNATFSAISYYDNKNQSIIANFENIHEYLWIDFLLLIGYLINNISTMFMHRNHVRKSNEERHSAGVKRYGMDHGGEKGDKRRKYKKPKRNNILWPFIYLLDEDDIDDEGDYSLWNF
ncbi:MAG: RHS repeat-associated core domain-containing protein, partial [Bacilli bacterium]|nr:RHS repeat-associated core domain-containing protein [Bacilli bacterium]